MPMLLAMLMLLLFTLPLPAAVSNMSGRQNSSHNTQLP
jgi:hypothetical protein